MSEHPAQENQVTDDDLLWRQLKTIPAFRALLRAVEARFYQKIELPEPVLDVGCGDGHFAQATFDQPLHVGIDPWWGPLNKAIKTGQYLLPLQARGDLLPLPDNSFSSAFSNSVLEHIPDVQPVLDEVGRVLKPDAPFVITVPSHHFSAYLGGAEFFSRLGLDGMADGYRRLFNQISRHAHTDPPKIWAERLAKAGFRVDRWQYYFSRKALQALEIGHVQGVPSAVIHALTGHWIIGPWESNLKWTERWVRQYYEEDFPEEGAYIFFLARKVAERRNSLVLPAAHPFALSELTDGNVGGSLQAVSAKQLVDAQSEIEEAAETDQEETQSSLNWRPIVTGSLLAIVLLFAFWGQSSLRDNQDDPVRGVSWLVLSALAFLLLIWRRDSRNERRLPAVYRPKLSNIPQRRWLYPLAIFLALLAPRFVAINDAQNQAIALVVWLSAAALATFALYKAPVATDRSNRHQISWFTISASVLLFLAALLLRLINLSQYPVILNGTEASIGLDAMKVVNGVVKNPFSAGWLTNPTLPLYLLALPLKLLGASVLSLRLISPFVGSITVVATFLIGQRLYGRAVGLTAAVLLLGSSFHIHFSRLGLTNAWDALLVLLALGFIAIAWQEEQHSNRLTWLLAGIAVGLCAYLYTSSHLLPLMLFSLMVLTLIFDREIWKRQWRNVIAMAAVALIVALPQLIYYQANPAVFMERANTLGILDSQGGWLSREATRSGTDQVQLIIGQLWSAALAFNATLDTGTSYGASVPLLNFVAGLLGLLGFTLAFVRSRRLLYSILVVWIVTTVIFAGALLEAPPNSHRYIITAPALCFLAAVALIEMLSTLSTKTAWDQSGDKTILWYESKPMILAISLVIASSIAIYDIGYYFGPYRAENRFGDRNTEIADSMADYLNSLEGEWTAYFYGPPSMYVDFPTIPFLANDFQKDRNLFDVQEQSADLPVPGTSNIVFIYLPERFDEIDLVRVEYPSGREQIFEGKYASPLYYAYEVRYGG